jgi:peptide/nickel transport system permease protein
MIHLSEYLSSSEPQGRLQARLGSAWRLWRRLSGSKAAAASLWVIAAVLLAALLSPALPLADPVAQNLSDRLSPPSLAHPLGTDNLGRDVLSRVVWGARPTFAIVFAILALTAPFGTLLGATAGFYGQNLERALMRICDVFMAFPRLVLALAIAAVLGADATTMVAAISLTGWPPYARVARSEAEAIRSLDFVSAAKVIGCSKPRILMTHVLPLCLPSMVVRMALDAPGIILVVSGLGFLGLGLKPPAPEWGAIVADGRSVIFEAWWVSTWPGLMILISGLAFNILGDGLRDALDRDEA